MTKPFLGVASLLIGLGTAIFTVAITVRCYMPCPFWDEWAVVDAIAKGAEPGNWHWLWNQQNEHRLAVPRLLVWLDLIVDRGNNVSLFAEILIVQVLHLAAICFVIQRFTSLPEHLRRALQGLFAFALFHPNQIENFTWAFQIGFVLPFALATMAFTLIAFLSHWKRPWLAITIAAIAPMLAALNLVAGLLTAPTMILIGYLKRIRIAVAITLVLASVATWFAYLYGYHRSGSDLSSGAELVRSKDLFVYVLTYFGASWTRLMPHKERCIAFASIIAFGALAAGTLRRRAEVSEFEWFLLAECVLALLTATLTAFGRLQFGVGQAFASRYQTPAMIYWAALGSLAMLWFHRHWSDRVAFPEAAILTIMLMSMLTFPQVWRTGVARADTLRSACQNVMGPDFDAREAKKLYEQPAIIVEARPFLLKVRRGKWSVTHTGALR